MGCGVGRPPDDGDEVAALPLGLLFGVAGALGADTVRVNGRPIHGPTALVVGTGLTAVLLPLAGVFLATGVCFGLWVVSLFRPTSVRVVLAAPSAGVGVVEAPDVDFPA